MAKIKSVSEIIDQKIQPEPVEPQSPREELSLCTRTDRAAWTHLQGLREIIDELKAKPAVALFLHENFATNLHVGNAKQDVWFALRNQDLLDLIAAERLLAACEESEDFKGAVSRVGPLVDKCRELDDQEERFQLSLRRKRHELTEALNEARETALENAEADPNVAKLRAEIESIS